MYYFAWAGNRKKQNRIQLKFNPKKRDATKMYPEKL